MTDGDAMPFTPELGARACELAADGKLMMEMAKELGVSTTTVNKWRLANPVFARAFEVARDAGIDALVDTLLDIAKTESDVYRARLIGDHIKWIAERRARRRYGQQVDINLNERIELGITLIEARKRTLLPGCDQTQLQDAQDAEYVALPLARATDTQSVALPDPPVDPFD
jgi:hypothetical protein